MVNTWMLGWWKRYKIKTKPVRRRVGLWLGLLGGKLIGRHNFETFKRICLDLAQLGHHRTFICVVRGYDPRLWVPTPAATFITGGAAQGSLNAFRIFEGPVPAFEKIYRGDASEWERCQFFYDTVLPTLDGTFFRVPRLMMQAKGLRLLLAHFELVSINPMSKRVHLDLVRRVVATLRSVPLSIKTEDGWLGRWQNTPYFVEKISKTRKILQSERLSFFPIERFLFLAASLPKFAAHGDLNTANVGVGDLVIDWDCFGYFPAEYDVALIVALYFDKDGTFCPDIEVFLSASHGGLDAVVSLEDYRANVYSLALLMADRRVTKLALYNRFFRVAA